MAPLIRTSRSEWIKAGLRALGRGGPDAVQVEPLAKELGASRGSFYWHFEDRDALLVAMLDTWEKATTEEVTAELEAGGGDASARLERLLALASPGVARTDLAVREWARSDQAVAERLRRIDSRRMDWLRTLLGTPSADPAETEARCLLAFSLLIAHQSITADHGPYSRADILNVSVRQLTTRPGQSSAPGPSALGCSSSKADAAVGRSRQICRASPNSP